MSNQTTSEPQINESGSTIEHCSDLMRWLVWAKFESGLNLNEIIPKWEKLVEECGLAEEFSKPFDDTLQLDTF